jgi:hypothetical protein
MKYSFYVIFTAYFFIGILSIYNRGYAGGYNFLGMLILAITMFLIWFFFKKFESSGKKIFISIIIFILGIKLGAVFYVGAKGYYNLIENKEWLIASGFVFIIWCISQIILKTKSSA